MTNKYVGFFSALIMALVVLNFTSCDSDDEGGESPDPTNLEIAIDIADDGSGVVEINATADNASEYSFDMGVDGDDNAMGTSTTGQFSYTYAETGRYDIEVRAIGSNSRFIRESRQIEVFIGDDKPIGPENGYSTPMEYDGMTLVWNDEFIGNSLNEADWTYEIGTGNNGWGNNELQYYRKENTLVANGVLTIEARQEGFGGRSYTSSRLVTQNKQDYKYGRIDIRALLPEGQGLWPALWMLGANFNSVGWPRCGEIDIMEMIGGQGRENTVHGTVHWDDEGTKADFGGSYSLSGGKTLADEYHVYTIIWDEAKIAWYINDTKYHEIDIRPNSLSEFHQNFFFIFNVAVGGNWPGSPDGSTKFPQRMNVDYVRVFQKN